VKLSYLLVCLKATVSKFVVADDVKIYVWTDYYVMVLLLCLVFTSIRASKMTMMMVM